MTDGRTDDRVYVATSIAGQHSFTRLEPTHILNVQNYTYNSKVMLYSPSECFMSATIEIISFNSLNAELNPICYLLALLAHHFLHVSRIRVKSLTLRLLMLYIYIYIYMEHPFLMFLDHTQRRTTVGRTPLDE